MNLFSLLFLCSAVIVTILQITIAVNVFLFTCCDLVIICSLYSLCERRCTFSLQLSKIMGSPLK